MNIMERDRVLLVLAAESPRFIPTGDSERRLPYEMPSARQPPEQPRSGIRLKNYCLYHGLIQPHPKHSLLDWQSR